MSLEFNLETISLDAEGSLMEPGRMGRKGCRFCKGTGKCQECDGDGGMECECDHGHTVDHDCDECDGSGECECVKERRDPSGGVVYAVTIKNYPGRIAFESKDGAMSAMAALKDMDEERVLRLWTLGRAA